jgi:DhnA family fructose-bisphosphate aldolase class Ia
MRCIVSVLGAHIIKTFCTGLAETFVRVVEMAAAAPVVAAGEPRVGLLASGQGE